MIFTAMFILLETTDSEKTVFTHISPLKTCCLNGLEGGVPHWLQAEVQHGGVRDHTGRSLLVAIQHAMDVLFNKYKTRL